MRRRRLGAVALALALIASLGGAIAQEAGEAPSQGGGRPLGEFDPGAAIDQAGEDLAVPEAPGPAASEETAEAYQATLQAYYAYREAGYEHRLGVFEWQSLSTKVIFFVVLLLVLAGIYFAAIQFHAGLRRRRDQPEPASAEETELSLSLREVKVRSPVLGVIILTISLAFFYLYLVHVYPIRNVF